MVLVYTKVMQGCFVSTVVITHSHTNGTSNKNCVAFTRLRLVVPDFGTTIHRRSQYLPDNIMNRGSNIHGKKQIPYERDSDFAGFDLETAATKQQLDNLRNMVMYSL